MRTRRPLVLSAAALLLCSCATRRPSRVQTFADLEAEMARNAAHYERSQLTIMPVRNLDSGSLSFSLFFQLPLRERVVYIMDSFRWVELDGEYAERMYAMLRNRSEPKAWWEVPDPPSAADTAYTQAIFKTIAGYSDAKIRAFCFSSGGYPRFQKNLKTWANRCGCTAIISKSFPTTSSHLRISRPVQQASFDPESLQHPIR